MTAVPLFLPIEPDHEPVRARQRLQDLGRATRCQHRVAQRPGQLLEHACPGEELELALRQVREELRLQEIGDEWVVARDRADVPGTDYCRPGGQRGEVQPGR